MYIYMTACRADTPCPDCCSQKASDEKVVKGKKGGAKGKKEEKEAVPAENGETEPEGVRELLLTLFFFYKVLWVIMMEAFVL